MNFKVKASPSFEKEAKRIAKKHPSIKHDLLRLIDQLETNPRLGTDLGRNTYKIRLAISDTNKGKSGGARIITYLLINAETVILADIYLKSEHETTNPELIIRRLENDGLI